VVFQNKQTRRIVAAYQWPGTKDLVDFPVWVFSLFHSGFSRFHDEKIVTSEGHEASPNQWLVMDNNEFSVHSPVEFASHYEIIHS
jgi:hypothetical protein